MSSASILSDYEKALLNIENLRKAAKEAAEAELAQLGEKILGIRETWLKTLDGEFKKSDKFSVVFGTDGKARFSEIWPDDQKAFPEGQEAPKTGKRGPRVSFKEEDIEEAKKTIFDALEKAGQNGSSKTELKDLFRDRENGEKLFLKVWNLLKEKSDYTADGPPTNKRFFAIKVKKGK